tara:strand:- start:49 stop:285 length:237 start_codon:yes stop_codon:yes gene_type:complete
MTKEPTKIKKVKAKKGFASERKVTKKETKSKSIDDAALKDIEYIGNQMADLNTELSKINSELKDIVLKINRINSRMGL